MSVDQIRELLFRLSPEQRNKIFDELRAEFAHPLEEELNTTAEMILEALYRADDLVMRGVRGVLAEGAFAEFILPGLVEAGWKELAVPSTTPDFRLQDHRGIIGLEIKLQRSEAGEPKLAHRMTKTFPHVSENVYVVETQKTRSGEKDGKNTRPYAFGDFDVLGVSLWPSTGDWTRFRYALASHLLPQDWRDDGTSGLMYHFQPVSMEPGHGWTDDFEEVADWFFSGRGGRIVTGNPPPDLFKRVVLGVSPNQIRLVGIEDPEDDDI